jgi:2-haloalkanoic acid dehalogenase type II
MSWFDSLNEAGSFWPNRLARAFISARRRPDQPDLVSLEAMLKLNRFAVLTFDCYGTLIDWERGILDELRPWAARHRLALSDDTLLEAFGDAESRCEAESPRTLYPQVLEEVLRRLAFRWHVALDAGDAERFGASVGNWPAFPDSPAALGYLQNHYRLVIISNVDRASFSRSEARLGVEFDAVITAEDVGSYKPDVRNFEFALARIEERFGVEPPGVLHVAQSLFHDILPATSVGLRTVWVNRRKAVGGWGATPPPVQGLAAQPDLEVSSLADLAALHRSELQQVPW